MVREGFHVFLTDSADTPEGAAQMATIRERLQGSLDDSDPLRKDLRTLLWSSIDNDHLAATSTRSSTPSRQPRALACWWPLAMLPMP